VGGVFDKDGRIMPDPDRILEFKDLQRAARAQFVASLDRGLKVGKVDVKDDATFTRILDTAIRTCGLDQRDLAELFETSHTSISRWVSGKTLPHAQYRMPIVQKLRDRIESMSYD
jgi:hypothetical protein